MIEKFTTYFSQGDDSFDTKTKINNKISTPKWNRS